MPTPMVAASAAAILKDITLSVFATVAPAGAVNFSQNPAKPRFARALLAARANRQVSARPGGGSAGGDRMKMLETK